MAAKVETNSMNNSSPQAMVIGGGGYIGSEVVRTLSARGFRITALHHHNPVRGDGVRSIKGDLRTFDWSRLEDDLPDVIIHSGRIPGRTWPGRILAGMQGRRANARLMKWLNGIPVPPALVYVSGTLVYGSRGELETDESAPLNPVGFQKYYVQAEYPFLSAAKNGNVPVYITRVPWVLGPDSWFRQFYWRAMQNQHEIPCFGDGENLMSVVHLRDCADLIVRISEAAGGNAMMQRPGGAVWDGARVSVRDDMNAGSPDGIHDGLEDEAASPGIYNIATIPAVSQQRFCQTLSGITGIPVRYYDERRLRASYGKTVTEALTFSLSLASVRDVVNSWHPQFPTVGTALDDVVRSLGYRNVVGL